METFPPTFVVERIADLALEKERAVVIYDWKFTEQGIEVNFGDDTTRPGGVVLMPDVIVMELEANGQPEIQTWKLQREDGRSVSIYRTRPITNKEFQQQKARRRALRKGIRP